MATLFDGIGANGFSSGFAAGNEIRKQRGLASGVQAYVDAETDGDKAGMRKALGIMAGVAPAETMNWINQQKALEQKNLERSFNTTNEIKNYNALVGMGVDPEKARDIAFKQNQKDPFQTMLDREEAKQYAEDLNAVRTAEANYPQLEANVNRLKEVSPKATYTIAGKVRDKLAAELFDKTTEGAKNRAELEAIVNNAVLPLLKQTFGAAFTAEEGLRLQKTLANPDATDEERMAELDTFINQKKADIETKRRKLGAYGKTTQNTQKQDDPLGIL